MNAGPVAARIEQDRARIARAAGDEALARIAEQQAQQLIQSLALKPQRSISPGSGPPTEPAEPIVSGAAPQAGSFSMRSQGDVWRIEFGGAHAVIKSTRGLEMLAQLVGNPDKELHVLER